MAPNALLHLLNHNHTVSVGVEPFSRRRHRLFFSELDHAHFVAIQDFETGEVVTVLPMDYHANLAWKISEKALRRAVWIANPSLHEQIYARRDTPIPGWKVNVMGVFFYNRARVAKYNLGNHRFTRVPQDAEEALYDEAFVDKVLTKINQKGLLLKSLEEIVIVHQKSGEILKIPWDVIHDFALESDGGESAPLLD